jgi:hypothetical protein
MRKSEDMLPTWALLRICEKFLKFLLPHLYFLRTLSATQKSHYKTSEDCISTPVRFMECKLFPTEATADNWE